MSTKLFVLKDISIGFIPDFVEIIHVELPYKRREVPMPEVHGQYFLLELLYIIDDESSTIAIPSDDILILLILNRNIENLQDLESL